MLRCPRRASLVALPILSLLASGSFANDLTHFESAPVHPVEVSPSENRLFVTHTADHRLVVFEINANPPRKIAEIMVGLEPVTVRARSRREAWVVNHISDDISIVDVLDARVTRTLLVGDEPTDVVFANDRAFVCVSQEDRLRVYNLLDLDQAPVDIPLDMSDPRSLALSPDGSTVYVCALDSGNRTTLVPTPVVEANGGLPAPVPPKNPALPAAPDVSLIVKHDGVHWLDEIGRNWDTFLPYTLLDNDVVAVSTSSLAVVGAFHDVGTALFNVAVHPSGQLYVTNQEAFNHVRFEPNVRGKFLHNRVAIIDPLTGIPSPHHLNGHIDYGTPAGNAGERALSVCIPLDIAISQDGQDVYVAAFGSRKVAVLDAGGNVTRRISVGEGPGGLALDEKRNRLYVLNRFASSLSVVDLSTDVAVEVSLGFDPSPSFVRDGRKFLYDGEISSAHGDLACGSCHLFAGFDGLAWDLGDPTAAAMIPVPPGQSLGLPPFHPMKGPMTTQALKILTDTEPLHWRGDRATFGDFNPAFVGLMGAPSPLDPGDMNLFTQFIFSTRYASNPFRNLDGSLPTSLNGANPAHGQQLFLTGGLFSGNQCTVCHALPTGENGLIIPGAVFSQDEGKKVPQLRNLYEKTRFDPAGPNSVRGFGFLHDGDTPTLFDFLEFPSFTFASDQDQRDVEAFLLAFGTETHAAVGAQWTMDGTNESQGIARLNTLQTLADANTIGLVAKTWSGGQPRGWMYIGGGSYRSDKEGDADVSQLVLLSMAGPGTEITFTGVVEGCENRLGIDRDLDGFRDGDELDATSDPGDPASTPNSGSTDVAGSKRGVPALLWIAGENPTSHLATLGFRTDADGAVRIDVYDVRGARATVVNDSQRARGTHVATGDSRASTATTAVPGFILCACRRRDRYSRDASRWFGSATLGLRAGVTRASAPARRRGGAHSSIPDSAVDRAPRERRRGRPLPPR
jgi:DNA-binding beta-propeller fold protein YncE